MLLPALLPRCQRQTAELIEIGRGERERWGEWGSEGGKEREMEGGREGVREGERERRERGGGACFLRCCRAPWACHQPSGMDQIVFFNRLDVLHNSPGSGERRHNSRS